MNDPFNRELERELEYDRHELDQSVQTNVPLLNPQQKEVYDTLMKTVDGGLRFLDAPGGSGKTFLISMILTTVRTRSDSSSCFFWNRLHCWKESASKLPLNLTKL